MPLFRRGSQLLRLGNALRNCCCRDAPKVCFCPSMCRYSHQWSGFDELTDGQQGTDCRFQVMLPRENGEFPFGLALDFNPPLGFAVAQSSIQITVSNELGFEYSHLAFGQIVPTKFPGTGFTAREIEYRTFAFVELVPLCNGSRLLPGNKFSLKVVLQEQVFVSTGRFGSDDKSGASGAFLYRNHRRASLEIPGVCIENSLLFCEYEDNTQPRLHLTEEIAIEIDSDGFSANGDRQEFVLDFPVIDTGDTSWHVEGRYPFDQTPTVTLKLSDSCRSGDCDCEVDLTGRSVVFKGKTFTYGSLQQFGSDDGSEFWQELPAGVFRKVTFDACDVSQQFVALEETAEIICSETIEEGQFWAVFFTVECRERDACGGPFDRSRTTIFNGIFTCDSEGFPSGTPTVELASDDLSDPAPTGDCAAFPLVPSINLT